MKALATVAAGRALQLLAAYLTLKLSTSMMTPGQLGQFNQMLAFATLLATGIVVPLVVYFARGVVGWADSSQFRRKLGMVMAAIAGATLVLVPAGGVFQHSLQLVHGVDSGWFLLLLTVFVFGFPSYTLTLNCCSILGQRGRSAVYANVASWGGLALAVILFSAGGTPWHWALGVFCGYLLSAQSLWIIAPSAGWRAAEKPAAPLSLRPRAVWSFVWPQVVIFSLWWMQSQSYRFVLADVSSVAAVGLFFAAYSLVSVPLQTFEAAFNELYSPLLYRGFDHAGGKSPVDQWNRYVAAYMPAVALFGGCLAGCAPHLSRIALGEAFQPNAAFFVWPAIAETGRALSSVNHTLGVAKVDMRHAIVPAVVGALAAPLLVAAWGPADPLGGTGAALCMASMLVLAAVGFVTHRTAGVRWPWARLLAGSVGGGVLWLAGMWLAWILPSTAAAAIGACALLVAVTSLVLYTMARPWLRQLRTLR